MATAPFSAAFWQMKTVKRSRGLRQASPSTSHSRYWLLRSDSLVSGFRAPSGGGVSQSAGFSKKRSKSMHFAPYSRHSDVGKPRDRHTFPSPLPQRRDVDLCELANPLKGCSITGGELKGDPRNPIRRGSLPPPPPTNSSRTSRGAVVQVRIFSTPSDRRNHT